MHSIKQKVSASLWARLLKTSANGIVKVVAAYSITLRITFSVLIIFGIILVALVLPVKLPDEVVIEEE